MRLNLQGPFQINKCVLMRKINLVYKQPTNLEIDLQGQIR